MSPEIIKREAKYLRRKLQPELAVYSQGTRAQNCALEIFSCFFWAATEKVEAILGVTKFDSDAMDFNDMQRELAYEPRFDRWTPSWQNDVIDMMATVLFDKGLAVTVTEGRSVIIPVLSKRGLLPTRESTAQQPKERTLDDWLIKV